MAVDSTVAGQEQPRQQVGIKVAGAPSVVTDALQQPDPAPAAAVQTSQPAGHSSMQQGGKDTVHHDTVFAAKVAEAADASLDKNGVSDGAVPINAVVTVSQGVVSSGGVAGAEAAKGQPAIQAASVVTAQPDESSKLEAPKEQPAQVAVTDQQLAQAAVSDAQQAQQAQQAEEPIVSGVVVKVNHDSHATTAYASWHMLVLAFGFWHFGFWPHCLVPQCIAYACGYCLATVHLQYALL